jgi:rhodanese-related sulfurtransferase
MGASVRLHSRLLSFSEGSPPYRRAAQKDEDIVLVLIVVLVVGFSTTSTGTYNEDDLRRGGELPMQHSEGFLRIVNEAKSRIREISAAETQKRIETGTPIEFIDVREDHEWSKGHARGAKHLGKGIIERDIEAQVADLNAEIILYCGGGYRSALAADALQRMGYRRVFSMAGGYKEWVNLGFPTVQD